MDDTQQLQEVTPETQEELQQTPEVEPTQEEEAQIVSRKSERISELIAQRKLEKEARVRAEQETEYYKSQLLKQSEVPEDNGISEDGIDPIKYAEWVRKQTRMEVHEELKSQRTEERIFNEVSSVKDEPELRLKSAQLYISQLIEQGLTGKEALEEYRLELAEATGKKSQDKTIRDAAGKFAKQEAEPVKGTPSNGRNSSLTIEDIQTMSIEEYKSRLPEINKLLTGR